MLKQLLFATGLLLVLGKKEGDELNYFILNVLPKVSQNITAAWETLHELEHKVNQLEKHHTLVGDHHHGGHTGHDLGHNAHSKRQHDDMVLTKLMQATGVEQQGFGPEWFYFSDIVNSTTMVKSGGSSLPAFSFLHWMYIKGHYSGSNWCLYQHDYIISWNAGGTLLVHLIYPDGRHDQLMLGDTRHNNKAQYTLVLPGGVYIAVELYSGDFVLTTDIAAPVWEMSAYSCGHGDELIRKFPQYEAMIWRLSDIRNDDKQLEAQNEVDHGEHSHKSDDHHVHEEHHLHNHGGYKHHHD